MAKKRDGVTLRSFHLDLRPPRVIPLALEGPDYLATHRLFRLVIRAAKSARRRQPVIYRFCDDDGVRGGTFRTKGTKLDSNMINHNIKSGG